MKKIRKNKFTTLVGSAVIILIILVGFFVFGQRNTDDGALVVTRGPISRQVSVTGSVKPINDVDLGFEISGKVDRVLAKVGDRVTAGDLLVSLDARNAQIGLADARVSYDDLVNVKPADIVKAENAVKDQEADVVAAYDTARSVLSAESKTLNDVINDLEDLFANSNYLGSTNFNAGQITQDRRTLAEKHFYEAHKLVTSFMKSYQSSSLISDQSALDNNLATLYQVAVTCAETVKEAKDIITYLKERDYGDSAEALSAYSQASDLAITTNNSVTAIFDAKEAVKNTTRLLTEARLDLEDVVNGPDATDIQSKTLTIEQKEKELSDYFLRSPISGVVTKQDARVGEIISANTSVVSVISDQNLQIEAYVPEIDIGQVLVGNPVDITFDAFPDEHFTGQVVVIDPSQTVIDGVVNFKITIVFEKNDTRLKSGLTANLTIKTVNKDNVLLVSQAAIIERDGEEYVQVVKNGKTIETKIATGVQGANGLTEVLSGLQEGDQISVTSE